MDAHMKRFLLLLMLTGCAHHVAPRTYSVVAPRYAAWVETHDNRDILYVYCMTDKDCAEAIKQSGYDRVPNTKQELKFVIVTPAATK
jgi:hypothetical protein